MTCRHRFCIYQEDNHCTAGEVSLDEVGMCYDCICISLSEEALEMEKEKLRKKFASTDFDLEF
ncbi:MAG: hypothetical protein R3Y63_03445 [Eubacteriales bacterium]